MKQTPVFVINCSPVNLLSSGPRDGDRGDFHLLTSSLIADDR